MEQTKKRYILVLVIYSISVILCTRITVGDDIWVFQNIVKLCSGFSLYGDCNIIQTPLFFLLGKLVCGLLGVNIFTYKLLNIFLSSIMIMLEYKILKKMDFNYLIFFLFIVLVCGINTAYNQLAILFVLVGILLQFEFRDKHENIYPIVQGIVMTLVILSKQNIGVLYALGSILMEIYLNYKNRKELLKKLVIQFSVAIVLLAIFVLLLLYKGMLGNFLSYTILGLGEFAKENIGISFFINSKYFLIIIGAVIFSVLALKNKMITGKEKDNVCILLCYGLPLLLTAYPIFNEFHVRIGGILIYILFFYLLYIILIKNLLTEKLIKIINAITLLIVVFIVLKSVYYFTIYIKKCDFTKEWDDPYFGAVLEDEMEEEIQEITEYMNKTETETGKKVIIFSDRAALYNVVLKRSNGAMDLPMMGNFGKDGQDGMIKQISELENTQLLINKESGVQESEKIREWIQNNMTCVGEIQEFYIYE